jgi:hypothetical protein
MPAPAPLKKPPTFDRLKKKQPLERKVTIALVQESLDAYDAATNALERARLLGEEDRIPDLETEVAEAKARLVEDSIELKFRSIGRKNYDALLEAHPPTPEQIKEFQEANADKEGNPGKGQPPYNVDTFAPALVAASLAEPELSEEQVQELFDEWNATELAELWVAALEVNTQRRVVSLGNG